MIGQVVIKLLLATRSLLTLHIWSWIHRAALLIVIFLVIFSQEGPSGSWECIQFCLMVVIFFHQDAFTDAIQFLPVEVYVRCTFPIKNSGSLLQKQCSVYQEYKDRILENHIIDNVLMYMVLHKLWEYAEGWLRVYERKQWWSFQVYMN